MSATFIYRTFSSQTIRNSASLTLYFAPKWGTEVQFKYCSVPFPRSPPPNPICLTFVFSLVSRLPAPRSIIILFKKVNLSNGVFSSFYLHSTILTPFAIITVECVPDDVLVRFVGRANNYDGHDF